MTPVILSCEFRRLHGSMYPVDPHEFCGYDDFMAGPYIDLEPGGFLLGLSVDVHTAPVGQLGIVMARSTYLRCGLAFGCGFLQPGWSGRLVLEFGNLNKDRPLRLWIGDPIAKITLVPNDSPIYTGRYAHSNPMGPQ